VTYAEWWNARRFLFDERFGPLLRQAENEAKAEEERMAAAYRKSVSVLKAQGSPDGSG
jgi:hypothetical protein